MQNTYKLYGAPLSLYTGKARAYLKFKQIQYEEVFSSRKVYTDIIVPKTGVRFIPVLETPSGEFVQDTSAIIDAIEESVSQRSVVPTMPKQKLVSAMFEMWGDEWLLIPAMHYRWNHNNFPFIYEEFGKIAFPNMPAFIRRFVGKKLGAKFKGFVPMLGITKETIPAIEHWYEQLVLPTLNAHFKVHDYLLGSRPCVGDFGLMGPLYAHLYRDPAPGKLMKRIAPHVASWVERMNQENIELGEWVSNDEIPESLLPLLQSQLDDFWPVQLESVEYTQKWIQENTDIEMLPRTVGKHQFTLGNASGERVIRTFSQWKMQRVLNVYKHFNVSEKKGVDKFLKGLGAFDLMQTEIKHPIVRKNNLLHVENQ